MRVVWVPHMLNQLDPAMMQDGTAASIQLIRRVKPIRSMRTPPPSVGSEYKPLDQCPEQVW